MPKPKNGSENKKVKKEEKMKKIGSSLANFVQHIIPTDDEIDKFEDFARGEMREEEMDEGLSAIYSNEDGETIDVSKLDIKRGRGKIFWIFNIVFFAIFSAVAAWAFYNYIYLTGGADPTSVSIKIEGPESVIDGEEFFYVIKYKNPGNFDLDNTEIRLSYPENFLYIDSQPAVNESNNLWKIGKIIAASSGEIKIKGKIIGLENDINIVLAEMSYVPSNFSSEFRREAFLETIIASPGITIEAGEDMSVLVNEDNILEIKYKKEDASYIDKFRINIKKEDNFEITLPKKDEEGANSLVLFENLDYYYFDISDVDAEEKSVVLNIKFNERKGGAQAIVLTFEYSEDGERYFKFIEKNIKVDVIKNDLNLNMIINGVRGDKAVNLGDTLNYSIVYSNKGEMVLNDVVIMVVVNSDYVDWSGVEDENNGKVSRASVSWSKNEIPSLGQVEQGDEGVIDFSIPIFSADKVKNIDIEDNNYQVESYAQFSIKEKPSASDNDDARSNVIINKINSNLDIEESVRYFNDDNIAVGSGPLPPRVGESTSYKVYWVVKNDLHELNGLRVEAKIPPSVGWDGHEVVGVGNIFYNDADHKIVWDIGRMPNGVHEIEAEFNINIMPSESDVNKILILLSGTRVEAIDAETGDNIRVTKAAKTTKLSDDPVVDNDGRVIQ